MADRNSQHSCSIPIKRIIRLGKIMGINARNNYDPVFSQPSIYIDGWLYGMSMTSVTRLCL